MQARVRLGLSARKPLRRSCVSSARNAGESAIGPERAQTSAEIVRVECAKCRRECDRLGLCARSGDRACRARETPARGVLCSITLVRGLAGELEDENWRLCSTTLVRGVSGELEDENWRLCSTTVVRGVSGELEDENWRLCSAT